MKEDKVSTGRIIVTCIGLDETFYINIDHIIAYSGCEGHTTLWLTLPLGSSTSNVMTVKENIKSIDQQFVIAKGVKE